MSMLAGNTSTQAGARSGYISVGLGALALPLIALALVLDYVWMTVPVVIAASLVAGHVSWYASAKVHHRIGGPARAGIILGYFGYVVMVVVFGALFLAAAQSIHAQLA